MRRPAAIFLMVFAVFYCVKDFIPTLISYKESTSWIADFTEEGESENEEKNEKENKEEAKINSGFIRSAFTYGNSQKLGLRLFSESDYIPPYFEINSPPPERV